MLFLLFQLGEERYALEAAQVVEVLPLLDLKKIPHSPDGVPGILNYRGQPVPAVDLSELTLGRPAHRRLSTRVILVRLAAKVGEERLLGLIAEKATETMHRQAEDFVPSGLTNGKALYLGPVTTDARGFIQWIKADQLLPASVLETLWQPTVESVT
jgi:chemotaxis-related protein WspB